MIRAAVFVLFCFCFFSKCAEANACPNKCQTDLSACLRSCPGGECKFSCIAGFKDCVAKCQDPNSCDSYCCEFSKGIPTCSKMKFFYGANICENSCSSECFLCMDPFSNGFECYTARVNDKVCDCAKIKC